MLTKTQFRVLFGFTAKAKANGKGKGKGKAKGKAKGKRKAKVGTWTCFGAKRTVFKGKFGGRYVLRKNKFGKMSKVYIKAAPARRTHFGYNISNPLTLKPAVTALGVGPHSTMRSTPAFVTPISKLVTGPKPVTVTPVVQAMFGKSKSSDKERKKAKKAKEAKAKKAKEAKAKKEKKAKKDKAKKDKAKKDKAKKDKAKKDKDKKDKAKKDKAKKDKAKKDKADKKKKSPSRSRSPVRTSGYMGGPYSARFGSYTTASPAQKMGSLRTAMGPLY